MTDETKKLFDAPFAVMGDAEDYKKFNVIIHSPKSQRHCCTVASCVDQKTAFRFVRLPELYDALMEAAKSYCQAADFDCPKTYCAWASDGKCKALKWLELLRKVRDGE